MHKERKEEKDNIYNNYNKILNEIEKTSLEIKALESKEIYDNLKEQKNKKKDTEKNRK